MTEISQALVDAAEALDRQAVTDTIASLLPWLRHLDGCTNSPCICGLAFVLDSLREVGS